MIPHSLKGEHFELHLKEDEVVLLQMPDGAALLIPASHIGELAALADEAHILYLLQQLLKEKGI